MTRPQIDLDYTVLDCPSPRKLAAFYTELLGWETVGDDEDWTVVQGSNGMRLAFQKATDFVPLHWPREGIRSHLDLVVDDMDASTQFAESLGARVMDDDAEHLSFRVLLDPVGHLFCLCART